VVRLRKIRRTRRRKGVRRGGMVTIRGKFEARRSGQTKEAPDL
jgi:hypothetical protein